MGRLDRLSSDVLTHFRAVFSRLSPKLRLRFCGNLALALLAAGQELLLAASISLLGIALAAPASLQRLPVVAFFAEKIPGAEAVLHSQSALLLCLLGGLCLLLLLRSLTNFWLVTMQAGFSQAVSNEAGLRLFSGFLSAPYLWHASQDIPALMTALGWRSQLAAFMSGALSVLTQLCTGTVLVVTVILLAPAEGAILFGVAGAGAFAAYSVFHKKARAYTAELSRLEMEQARISWPAVQGIREVIIHGQQETFYELFRASLSKSGVLRTRLAAVTPLTPYLLETLGMATLFLAAVYLASTNASPERLSGTLALLAGAGWRLLPALSRLVRGLMQLHSSMVYVDKVTAFLDEVSPFIPPDPADSAPMSLERSIELRGASFRYPSGGKRDALRDITLEIRKGATIGFTGLPGSGKSTLAGVLTGLLPCTAGTVLIDGRELDARLRAGWAACLGYVPQSPFLLNDSIAKNVAFSRWGKDVDEERVLEACRASSMHFLADLPQGIHTHIGERGLRLSGGQAQLLSIARALYARPQLLLLDEATSSLDERSEQAVLEAVAALRSNMTIILIAHRLNTLRYCDTVFWLDEGQLRQSGGYDSVVTAYKQFLEVS